ncbi:DUF4328 domain-containing protein [Streptomyces justiciae]|uniref:DUF4328 domain-containing protein n=1 Tax=Streptomyces justiciae TaxID=2780140 RepID=UPI002117C691|nr:DUF4328 domain-containing protein [Streptomyces justiciae]MCW8377854.1 DUF4328 domain-containing protein [Streptomyces justiciae]
MIDNRHDHFIAPAAWLQSPIGLGRAAVAGLGVVIATDLFALGAGFFLYDVIGDLAGGARLDGRADLADRLYSGAGIAQTVALLTTAVLFLCWFHRVRVNAEVFDPYGHDKKRGWAVWGWIVPIVNLWFPRRITLDIWNASSPWSAPRPHGLVNTWWTFWTISLLSGRAASTAYRKAESADEIRDAVGQLMFSDAVDIVAAALAVVVVLRLNRMQYEKALAGPGAGTGPGPGPAPASA